MKSKRKNEVSIIIYMILVGVVSLAYYWCMIDCPYRGDDCLNANSAIGTIYYSGESIGELTLRVFKNWVATGRFFPFSTYNYYLFVVFNTLHSYRIFLFCITLVMAFMSGLVIKRLTKNYLLTSLLITLTPMMFYLSEYCACNPLLCYHGLIQITVIWFLSSVLCLLKWIDTDKKVFAVAASVFYFISLCTYEVSYVFIVFIVFAVLYNEVNIWKALKKMRPIFISWVSGALILVIVKMNASTGGYSGVEMSFSISKIVNTALCMMAAAFPIYNAFATGYIFEVSDISKSDLALSIAFALIFVVTFYIFKEKEATRRERVIVYCMGSSLWILPAFLVGMSARYQNEIRWGTDWLPYFVEVIGTSIILVQFCRDLYETVAHSTSWKWMKHILSFCLFIIIGFMALWNRTAGEHSYSKTEMNGFYTIQSALESGIVADVSDRDIIHVWQTIGSEVEPNIFYSRFAQKRVNADILVSEEQYNSMDYSIYENEYIAKNIDLGSGQHIFAVGYMKDNVLNLFSFPLIYIPRYEGSELVVFSTESDNDVEIIGSDILKFADEDGVIVQIPYDNVIINSIQIRK